MVDNVNEEYDNANILKGYFSEYLRKVRGVKLTTVNHYLDALNNISRRLKDKKIVITDIYEIDSLNQLNNIREILYKDPEFIKINTKGNRMYSAGLNNYIKFASGENFHAIRDNIFLLDIPMEPELCSRESSEWKRSKIIRNQALEFAGNKCEIDSSHKSFITENTRKSYMEGHHAISMKLQPRFAKSLDIYANIVCLCPICHRKIHYGLNSDREQMMNQIYEMRERRLRRSGIVMSKNMFISLISNDSND